MRTRRSPRNQERLWRALGKQGEQPQERPPTVRRCFDCVSYGGSARNRNECTLIGRIVNGATTGRECFKALR